MDEKQRMTNELRRSNDMNFEQAIHGAIQQGNQEKFKSLVESDPERAIEGSALIHVAQAKADPVDMLKILLDVGVDVNKDTNDHPSTDYVGSALNLACLHGNKNIVGVLIGADAELNSQDGGGFTPINNSTLISDSKIFEMLLEAGADWTIPDRQGFNVMATCNFMASNNNGKSAAGAREKLNILEAHIAAKQGREITEALKDSWSPDTDDGKRLLDKLSASAPGAEQDSRQARRKM